MMKKIFVVLWTVLLMSAPSHLGYALPIVFNDFSSTGGLTLNGSAATTTTGDGEVLRLTPALPGQSGNVFSSEAVDVSTFSTAFTFRITESGGSFDGYAPGADGLAFVIQSSGPAVIGGGGGHIGYGGIPQSVGIEFDTWYNAVNNDPDSNHLGIVTNGTTVHGPGAPDTQSVSPDFDNGNLWHAWIEYNGSTLEVRTNQSGVRPTESLLSLSLDIESLVGPNAYVGFTSGTGSGWGHHDLVSWEFDSAPVLNTIPEPGTLLLLACGLMGVLAYGQNRLKR